MAAPLEARFRERSVTPGTVACVWLGQAGYLLKSPAGVIVAIDPYLSDYAEAQWGMRRVLPPPINPALVAPDLLLISHWHEDHLDQPLVRQWAERDPGIFAGPGSCAVRAIPWGWPVDKVRRLELGSTLTLNDVTVTAHFARHETPDAPAPDALSYLLDMGGVRIWAVCDTEYDARLRGMANERIDVALTPINGVGGNLTDREAALLLSYVQPGLAIPNHYNMWEPATFGEGATLDPHAFVAACTAAGGGKSRVLDVGEIVTLARQQ